ncbi:hypothetical protein ACG2DA_20580, partial [Alienimonas sp. DA493]
RTDQTFRTKVPNGLRGAVELSDLVAQGVVGRDFVQTTQTVYRRPAPQNDPGSNPGGGEPGDGDGQVDPSKLAFGVKVRQDGGRGVSVERVFAGTPATRLRDRAGTAGIVLEPRDRILSIGGRPTDSEAQFTAAVDGAPPTTELQVVNHRDGSVLTLIVSFNRPTDGDGAIRSGRTTARPNR